jgi:hypothetical protein
MLDFSKAFGLEPGADAGLRRRAERCANRRQPGSHMPGDILITLAQRTPASSRRASSSPLLIARTASRLAVRGRGAGASSRWSGRFQSRSRDRFDHRATFNQLELQNHIHCLLTDVLTFVLEAGWSALGRRSGSAAYGPSGEARELRREADAIAAEACELLHTLRQAYALFCRSQGHS